MNDSGDLRGVAGGDGKLGCPCGKAGTSHLCDGSAHSSGCVVNGSNVMAIIVYTLRNNKLCYMQWFNTRSCVCCRQCATAIFNKHSLFATVNRNRCFL